MKMAKMGNPEILKPFQAQLLMHATVLLDSIMATCAAIFD